MSDTEKIELIPINVKEFDIEIKGITPLIVHRFSEKARKQIEDKQQKRAKEAKKPRDPNEEYLASLYPMPGFEKQVGQKSCKYGIPAVWIKLSAVDACRFVDGLKMTLAAFQRSPWIGAPMNRHGRPDCYDYVRRYYGVPAFIGTRVKVHGKEGVLLRASPLTMFTFGWTARSLPIRTIRPTASNT